MALYREYSREVWSTVREMVPTVEQTGIDEGYLDLGEIAPFFDDARALAEAVQAVVRARTRLSCSLGVATSKVVAKVASDHDKPAGLTAVRPGREAAFLAPFPVRLLPGVGPRGAEQQLAAAGVETIGQLALLDDLALASPPPRQDRLGRTRPGARDRPPRGLEMSVERISISHEETFSKDVAEAERLHDELQRMADRLSEHLPRARGQVARTVTTKLRYPDFSSRTRSTSLPAGGRTTGAGSASSHVRSSTARWRPARTTSPGRSRSLRAHGSRPAFALRRATCNR